MKVVAVVAFYVALAGCVPAITIAEIVLTTAAILEEAKK